MSKGKSLTVYQWSGMMGTQQHEFILASYSKESCSKMVNKKSVKDLWYFEESKDRKIIEIASRKPCTLFSRDMSSYLNPFIEVEERDIENIR